MNIFVPNYYNKFKCIADKCKHNCCIGWEIDIDADTLNYYSLLEGDIGSCIKNTIKYENGTACFKLEKDDRCPHLNENNLCNIIINLGDDALCDICTDHPRFRNFYSGFTEMGLGFSCEECARIILSFKDKFCPVPFDLEDDFTMTEDEEYAVFRRGELFDILQNRDLSIFERFSSLAGEYDFEFTNFSLKELCGEYIKLERLDNGWTHLLEKLKNYDFDLSVFKNEQLKIAFEQLACYFMYRHFTEGMWDYSFYQRVKFVLSSCYIIGALVSMSNIYTIEQMAEFARMYSAEVEYSDINMEAILQAL